MIETIRDRQLIREKAQYDGGIARYQKHRKEKAETDMTPGKELLRRSVEPVAVAIEALIERVASGKAGRGKPAIAVSYLQHLQAEPVAYITARVCINAAARRDRLSATAMRVSTLIEEHYQFDELQSAAPGLSNSLERKAKKWTGSTQRRFIMRIGVRVMSVIGLEWKQGDKLHLGMKLVELFITETGLAEKVLMGEGKNKTNYRLQVTPSTSQWLSEMHERFEFLDPRYTPMICPPRKWTSPINGGYLTKENRMDFVGGVGTALRDDLFSVDMSNVYRAVNSVQSTAWRINRAVLDVLRVCWAAGYCIGGLPEKDDLPIPERPSDIPREMKVNDMEPEMVKRLRTYRRTATKAHEQNCALVSKRLAVASKINMASDVQNEPSIYFPHNVDFRGRIYSVVPGLNPQADDVGKSLLEFAEGKELGESGAYWLHVQIANLFGVDKVSFDERVAWVQENGDLLLDSAASPLDGERFWTTADDPWCALAACYEYAGWTVAGSSYVSHLPIAMDGSCSGLQHFSAMLKDAEGGRTVNLLPTDSPSDIYTSVAEAVEICLNDPALSTDQLAQAWRGKVLRKIVKRPCMTFAYSVTARGMRDQIMEECKKQAEGGEYLPGYDNFEAACFLAPIVEQAIKNTVDRAAEAMAWLKESVRGLITNDMPVNWFTPDGFAVQHRYMKMNGKRFKVWFQGLRMDVQLRVETRKPDLRKHTSSIAPNFVHSMDASHLRMVVNRMTDEGITSSFAMIHDSFGVHACDVDELHYAIRDEFIKLYSVNQLEAFREQVLNYLSEEAHVDVPATPKPGTLDLEEVRRADFFFA